MQEAMHAVNRMSHWSTWLMGGEGIVDLSTSFHTHYNIATLRLFYFDMNIIDKAQSQLYLFRLLV